MSYCSTTELARFLNLARQIPDPTLKGSTRIKEEVGVGNNSATRFFLDNSSIIAGTYTLSYGASESSVTALTETTHYTLDKDMGEITLTTAGKTAISTNKIYAAYSYIDTGEQATILNDTILSDAIDYAESEINNDTCNLWVDGTAATPGYTQNLDEKHSGQGVHQRDYYSDTWPIANVTTTLDGDVSADDTTITVVSVDGFPETGYINIGSDKVTYTGKDADNEQFTGCTGVDSDHDDGDAVNSFVVEISTTESGTDPSWTVLQLNEDFDIDFTTGRIHVYRTDYDLTYYAMQYPPRLIPNRFRVSYLMGNDTIPNDIKQLCLLIAAKQILHTTVRKGISSGIGDFNKANIDVDEEWIQNKLSQYRNIRSTNI